MPLPLFIALVILLPIILYTFVSYSYLLASFPLLCAKSSTLAQRQNINDIPPY